MLNADIEACEEVGEGRAGGNKKILSGNYRHTILSDIVTDIPNYTSSPSRRYEYGTRR